MGHLLLILGKVKNTMKKICLHCQEGSSDKLYNIEIAPEGSGYVVNFAYGRRGNTLKLDTKTDAPVSLVKAEEIFDSLVAEKKRGKRGKSIYQEVSATGGTSTQYVAPPANERKSGVFVQLLKRIEESELENFYGNHDFGAMEKHDGERMVVQVSGASVSGINIDGLFRGMPETVISRMREVCTGGGEYLIDGESIGDYFIAFDVLMVDGVDVRTKSFGMRHALLKGFLEKSIGNPTFVRVSRLAGTEAEKRELCDRIRRDNGEGFVFKKKSAPYTAGTGGDAFKFKLVEDATCLVASLTPNKRSVGLQVRASDGSGAMVNVGKCTIPVNADVPAVGSYVDIQYLYAYPQGSLYQPVYKGLREDKHVADLHSSLKFKAAAAF